MTMKSCIKSNIILKKHGLVRVMFISPSDRKKHKLTKHTLLPFWFVDAFPLDDSVSKFHWWLKSFTLSCAPFGLPWWLSGKESSYQCNRCRFSPGSGRSPGEGNGNPLQYSCLENPMERGAWQAIVHRIARVGHDLATKPPPPLPQKSKLPIIE